jgi:predicted dehydrogenase
VTPPSTTDLQVGLVGFGLAGRIFHAPFVAATPGLHLAAVVTSSPDRQAQVRAEYPDATIVGTIDELWTRIARLDLVVIGTPNISHVAFAEAAIANGVAVLVDKPLAPTSAAGKRLVEQARARRVPLTVYQNRRWDADFQTLQALVASGELGDLVRFESRFARWRPEPRPGWRESANPDDAGGLLMDLGSHLIDQACVLFGPVAHVYAELDCRRPGVSVDDDAFVALTHRSGVRSHLWMSVVAADSAPRLVARGTRAAYVKYGLDAQEPALQAGDRPRDNAGWGQEPESAWGRVVVDGRERTVPSVRGNYGELYVQLSRALRGEGPLPVDPSDSVRVLEIIEAARRSAEEQIVVRL